MIVHLWRSFIWLIALGSKQLVSFLIYASSFFLFPITIWQQKYLLIYQFSFVLTFLSFHNFPSLFNSLITSYHCLSLAYHLRSKPFRWWQLTQLFNWFMELGAIVCFVSPKFNQIDPILHHSNLIFQFAFSFTTFAFINNQSGRRVRLQKKNQDFHFNWTGNTSSSFSCSNNSLIDYLPRAEVTWITICFSCETLENLLFIKTFAEKNEK